MSLLNFFRRKDPTADWPACRPVPLRFDVERGELNGIAFGAPMAALRALGRPSNPAPRRTHGWFYPSLGLEVGRDASDRVHFFLCVFQADEDETDLSRYADFQPCRVRLRFANGEELFGFSVDPDWRWTLLDIEPAEEH